MKILIVEDERKTGDYLRQGLSEAGFVTDLARDGVDGAHLATQNDYDLVVLDVMLPGIDGWEVLRRIRVAGGSMPVLFLTARDQVDDRVKGLELGADDYLVKPFAFDELLARIAAVRRRAPVADRIEVGDLVIDVLARKVWRNDVEIRLTTREFDLLRYLAENAGRVMSRTRLLEAVWDTMHDPATNVVEVYVSYLRAKIDKGFEPPLLHTVRGVGYVLEAGAR